MNLQQLNYIVQLDKYKSFSKAAQACFITQATLSTMVKKLEEELDIIIFDRKNNPIITTECGKEIIKEAQKILFHSQQLIETAAQVKGIIKGELKIGIIPTIASNLLHRILPKILNKYPDLKLVIQEITSQNIINKLKMGLIDVGIVSTPLQAEELEEQILYYEKLMVYGNVENLETKYISPADIRDQKVWLLEQGNCLSDQIINVCGLSSKKINANLEFQPNSFDSLLNIVDQLKGLTLIPELYFLDLPEHRRKTVKDFVKPFPVREVSMVYYRPYAKLRLIEAIATEVKQLICPILETSQIKNSDLLIAQM